MAAPVIETFSTSTSGGSDPVTVTYPTGITSGDLLVACCSSGTTTVRDWDALAGWTELFDYDSSVGGINGSSQVSYKVAAGTETGTFSWGVQDTFTEASMVLLRISGAEDPATTAIVYANSTDGTGGSATSPNATASSDDTLSIRMQCFRRNGSITSVTDHALVGSADDSSTIVYVWEDVVTSGATGTKSVAYTPTWWSAPALAHSVLLISPPAAGGSSNLIYPDNNRSIFGGYES